MSDFRSDFYRRYVSAFKGKQSDRDPRELASYWAWCRHTYLPLLDDLGRDEPLLELGCGPGHMLAFLRDQGFTRTEGVDLSEEQVRLATAQGLNARVADVFETLEGSPRTWGAMLAIDFLEHFSREELLRLMPMIHAALRPGGVLIAQTPNGAGLFPHQIVYGDLTHMTILTPESLQQLLRVTGFDAFTFRETGPVAKNAVGTVRRALWRMIRAGANLVRRIETGKTQEIWTENVIVRCRAME